MKFHTEVVRTDEIDPATNEPTGRKVTRVRMVAEGGARYADSLLMAGDNFPLTIALCFSSLAEAIAKECVCEHPGILLPAKTPKARKGILRKKK